MSSSSIPFAFPTTIWDSYEGQQVVCTDGGVAYGTNLVSAVTRCQEQVDDDSQIILDIVVCGGNQLESWDNPNNAVNNHQRFSDIQSYYNAVADIYEFMQAFPNVTYRYYVEPSASLGNALDFDNSTTWPM